MHRADEQVLLVAEAEVEANGVLCAVGEVRVTTRRVQFRLRRMERVIWPRLDLDVGIDMVTRYEVSGVRRRLDVTCGERTVRFCGAVVPALYGALESAADLAAGAVTAARVEHEVWTAALCRDPLSHPGALVRTATTLTYIGSGSLDALYGLEHLLVMPARAIERIAITGRFDRRIEITTADVSSQFTVAAPTSRLEALIGWLADQPWGPVCVGADLSQADRDAIGQILTGWHSSGLLPAQPRLFCLAMQLHGATAEPGWLMVVGDQLIWLPRTGPTGKARPFMAELKGQLYRLVSGPANEVHLKAAAGTLHRWRLPSRVEVAAGPEGKTLTGGAAPLFRRALNACMDEIEGPVAGPPTTFVAAPDGNVHRRKTFRVAVPPENIGDVAFSVRTDGVAEALGWEVANWSLSGCAARASEPVPPGTTVDVDLHTPEKVHVLRAEVVHDRKLEPGAGWLLGMRFIGNWGDVEQISKLLWHELQRLATKRKQDADDGSK